MQPPTKDGYVLEMLREITPMFTSDRVLDDFYQLDQIIETLEKSLRYLKSMRSYRAELSSKEPRQRSAEAYSAKLKDPTWQRGEILRTFQRIQRPLSAIRLHWGYLRGIPAQSLQERCEELSLEGILMKLVDGRSPEGRFKLAKVLIEHP